MCLWYQFEAPMLLWSRVIAFTNLGAHTTRLAGWWQYPIFPPEGLLLCGFRASLPLWSVGLEWVCVHSVCINHFSLWQKANTQMLIPAMSVVLYLTMTGTAVLTISTGRRNSYLLCMFGYCMPFKFDIETTELKWNPSLQLNLPVKKKCKKGFPLVKPNTVFSPSLISCLHVCLWVK